MTLEEFAAQLGGKGAGPDEIQAFEALIGAPLPDDYRRFLGLTGGGSVPGVSCTFFDLDNDNKESVRRMGGLGNGEMEAQFRDPSWHPLPQDMLWIGSDVGGNPFTLCLRGPRRGELFLIDHEMIAFEGEPDPIELAEENGLAFLLAPSFGFFVERLAPEV